MAAGWQMKSCNQTAMGVVDIQLVCKDDNPDCDHLFQGGAVDTIIRLPDSVCSFLCLVGRSPRQLIGSLSVRIDAICARGSASGSSVKFVFCGRVSSPCVGP